MNNVEERREGAIKFPILLHDFLEQNSASIEEKLHKALMGWVGTSIYEEYLQAGYTGLDERILKAMDLMKNGKPDKLLMYNVYALCAVVSTLHSYIISKFEYAPFDQLGFIYTPFLDVAFFGDQQLTLQYIQDISECIHRYESFTIKDTKNKIQNEFAQIKLEHQTQKKEIETQIKNFTQAASNVEELYRKVEEVKTTGTFGLLAAGFTRRREELVKSKTLLTAVASAIIFFILIIPAHRILHINQKPTIDAISAEKSQKVNINSESTDLKKAEHTENSSSKSDYAKIIMENKIAIYTTALLISFEIILIYLLRITLIYYNKAKEECAQYDARISICEFIPYYHEYLEKKSIDPSPALRLFETHVISKIDESMVTIPTALECTLPIKLDAK